MLVPLKSDSERAPVKRRTSLFDGERGYPGTLSGDVGSFSSRFDPRVASDKEVAEYEVSFRRNVAIGIETCLYVAWCAWKCSREPLYVVLFLFQSFQLVNGDNVTTFEVNRSPFGDVTHLRGIEGLLRYELIVMRTDVNSGPGSVSLLLLSRLCVFGCRTRRLYRS